ncbi:hypothetical protein [Ktedonobacter racemifer]|uniref:Uncharacterized protein n=1 Tax=Ktedonobacter racemifer DSM 44963 TaxID=485913 RepID=D6TZ87_KTERA|nr:hypothetical protein [Ktedonobacter racemifer]EFH81877.1 hypothetical protein Krac_2634 [Ktedonobacter racemifer DSM 44963]
MANSRKKQAKETSTASTRGLQPLQGWGLVIARIIWAAIAFVDLIILIIGVPALTIQVQKPCLDLTRATCSSLQLLPTQMAAAQFLGITPGAYAAYTVTCDLLITLLFFIIGALIFWHKSNDWMGLFVSILLITFGGLGMDLVHTNALPDILPSNNLIFLIYNFLSILSGALDLLVWPALGLFFCTFPDGRLVPRWSWIFPCLFVVQFVFYVLPSPWNFQNWPPFLQLLEILLVYGGSVGTQIYRYFFVASPLQRQQIKWLAFGFGLVIFVVLPLESLLLILNGPHSILQLADPFTLMFDYLPIPLALGVALLRYRLWDIDVLINRTLVYGLLTLILAAVYFGLVFGAQALLVGLIGKNDGIVIVGSTLVVAVLFQPLRRGIQNVIDRRFYRQKYDAQRTLQAFSATLHQQTDLAQLSGQIMAVIQETVQPASVSLWLCRPAERESESASSGRE